MLDNDTTKQMERWGDYYMSVTEVLFEILICLGIVYMLMLIFEGVL